MDGFTATLNHWKSLHFDIDRVPPIVLRSFYTSGAAFHEPGPAFTDEERRVWRESVQRGPVDPAHLTYNDVAKK